MQWMQVLRTFEFPKAMIYKIIPYDFLWLVWLIMAAYSLISSRIWLLWFIMISFLTIHFDFIWFLMIQCAFIWFSQTSLISNSFYAFVWFHLFMSFLISLFDFFRCHKIICDSIRFHMILLSFCFRTAKDNSIWFLANDTGAKAICNSHAC